MMKTDGAQSKEFSVVDRKSTTATTTTKFDNAANGWYDATTAADAGPYVKITTK